MNRVLEMVDEGIRDLMSSEQSRPSSRLPNFYKHDIQKRVDIIADHVGLSMDEKHVLRGNSLSLKHADVMIENVIGLFDFPLGVACNVQINSRDYLIPMVVEETSVVAAVGSVARLVRGHGALVAHASDPIMIGQIQLVSVADPEQAERIILQHKEQLLAIANQQDPVLINLGGGARDLEVRLIKTLSETIVVVHLLVDVRDAMGANAVNTMAEAIGPIIAEMIHAELVCQIISNLSDHRMVYAHLLIDPECLARDGFCGRKVAERIVKAYEFAEADHYRAATHNKGVMNGIDAVLLATGNDWRAVEAGAHTYAARNGAYKPLTRYFINEQGMLEGELEMPLAIGTIGGVTKIHPGVQVVFKIMGITSTRELTEVIAGIGLLQNFCALRSLVTEGIQRGHMALHAKNLAMFAGANGELAHLIADQMIEEGKISFHRAQELVAQAKLR